MTALIRIDRSWEPGGPDRPRPIRFCSRCGQPEQDPPGRVRGGTDQRVCRQCGMGLMLTCSRDALPGARAAFVIVRFDLSIGAVSEAGERIFGREQSLVGRSLLDVVTSPLGDDQLARRVGHAGTRPCDPAVMPARLLSDRAGEVGTMAARVATCAPPRAALVTFEPSGFGRSRVPRRRWLGSAPG
jgi:hypothetical protein